MFRVMDNDKSKIHTPKQLLIYAYLFMNRTMRDEVKISIEDLVSGCGYIPRRDGNRAVNQFRQELYTMYQNNCSGHFDMFTTVDIQTINPADRFTLNLSDILYDYSSFTKLPFSDYDKIISSTYAHKDKMLLVYLYIKSYIFERKTDRDGVELQTIEEAQEGYSLSYDQIVNDTHISKPTVMKIIDILEELQLLYCYTTGGYKDKSGKIRNAPNIYVLYGCEREIPYIIERLKKNYGVDGFFEIKKEDTS